MEKFFTCISVSNLTSIKYLVFQFQIYPLSKFPSNLCSTVFQGETLAVLLDDKDVVLINREDSSFLDAPNNKVTENRRKMTPVRFEEVINGLCVVTAEKSTVNSTIRQFQENNCVTLGFEFVFLRGEQLSQALQKFVSLFSRQRGGGAQGWEYPSAV